MTTTTHLMTVELEHEDGYRFWSAPVLEGGAVSAYIDEYRAIGYGLSDIDHACACPCGFTDEQWCAYLAAQA